MKPSIALNRNRDALRALIAQFRVTNPRVFGSAARNEDLDGSDLDLLIDVLPGTTLFDLGDLHHKMEQLLGIRVDLRTPGDLPKQFRQRVIDDSKPL
jgi:hypothetical protein